jgi:RNA-directed DNA polymerase
MSVDRQPNTPPPEGDDRVSQKLAVLGARARKEGRLTNVIGLVDVELLTFACGSLRRDAAAGVDGQTWHAYQELAEEAIPALHARLVSGQYRAPMVRRVRIPKPDGGSRPLGITTLEDRIVQKAVAWVLSAVYEQDFLDCSYGYRPGRSAHTALAALHTGLERRGARAVVEVDIQGYFDHVNHDWLRQFLRHRVNDGGLLRLIGKWLNAGVLEAGVVRRTKDGVPQGGPVSPVLANIYLHYVLDLWFDRRFQPTCRGYAQLVRYADDLVAVFAHEADAARFRQEVADRLAAFGLTIAPEKTAVVPFDRDHDGPQGPAAGTFTFLGFTHYVGRTRSGQRKVGRTPSRKARERFLQRLSQWLTQHRHDPVREQQRYLAVALRGYYQYFGLRDCSHALASVQNRIHRRWWQVLRRRSQRAGRRTDWETIRGQPWFQLPPPRVTWR